MNGVVVTGKPQRNRVGIAAHDGRFGARQFARRLRQPRLAAHQARALGREGHFQLGLARNRAQRAGNRALERLGRSSFDDGLVLMLDAIFSSPSPRAGKG